MIREMHKTLDLLSRNKHNYMSSGDYDLQKHDIEEGKKNIIFLDIDGVIQPYHLAERFNHDLDQLIDYLCDKYEDPIYKEMDKYDVGAAFYDWDEVAIGYLTKLIRITGAYVVVHSGWIASNNLPKIKALFRLYNLDEYIIDICAHASKERAVFEYIDANRDWIHRYVVIDDSSLMSVYGYSFVQPNDVMNMENYEQCVSILNNAYSFERKEEAINVFKQERCVLKVSYKPAVMQGKKLLFLKYNSCDKYLTESDCLITDNYIVKAFSDEAYEGIVAIEKKGSSTYHVVETRYYRPLALSDGCVIFFRPLRIYRDAYKIYDDNKKEIAEYARVCGKGGRRNAGSSMEENKW